MKYILTVIVVSQFFCTSLWFAGNSIILNIVHELRLNNLFLGHLTSAIQFGFIAGTFLFALLSVSDRYSPSLVFFWSAILAAIFNLGITLANVSANDILICRFFTGFFLAGIYPVGMKIASDYFPSGLGKSIGYLVGALVLGTAFPHLLKNAISDFSWKYIIYATSILSFAGGLCIFLFVPNGPYRKPAQKIIFSKFLSGFNKKSFRVVAYGYFGHMWELYTFWAFLPTMLYTYKKNFPEADFNVPLLSFLIIAVGSIACVVSGTLSGYFGAKKIAALSLLVSCICCLISPVLLFSESTYVFLIFLFIWGFFVIADSPLFSSLVAQNAPDEIKGTSLTITNCIGFAITIVSIQFINLLSDKINYRYLFVFLAIGPILGIIALLREKSNE